MTSRHRRSARATPWVVVWSVLSGCSWAEVERALERPDDADPDWCWIRGWGLFRLGIGLFVAGLVLMIAPSVPGVQGWISEPSDALVNGLTALICVPILIGTFYLAHGERMWDREAGITWRDRWTRERVLILRYPVLGCLVIVLALARCAVHYV